MLELKSTLITIVCLFGVPFLIVLIINFFLEWYRHRTLIHAISMSDEENGEDFYYSNSETRNVYMKFKDFDSLYRGNFEDWEMYYNSNGGEIVFACIPFYKGLESSTHLVYFVHFSTIFGYIAFLFKYKWNQSQMGSNVLMYTKIANDVSDKIHQKLDAIQIEREKAFEDMNKTLESFSRKYGNSNNKDKSNS